MPIKLRSKIRFKIVTIIPIKMSIVLSNLEFANLPITFLDEVNFIREKIVKGS